MSIPSPARMPQPQVYAPPAYPAGPNGMGNQAPSFFSDPDSPIYQIILPPTIPLKEQAIIYGGSIGTGMAAYWGIKRLLKTTAWTRFVQFMDKARFINNWLAKKETKSIDWKNILGNRTPAEQKTYFIKCYMESNKGLFKEYMKNLPAQLNADLQNIQTSGNVKEIVKSIRLRAKFATGKEKKLLLEFSDRLMGFNRWINSYNNQEAFLNEEYKLLNGLLKNKVYPFGRLISKAVYYLERTFSDNPVVNNVTNESNSLIGGILSYLPKPFSKGISASLKFLKSHAGIAFNSIFIFLFPIRDLIMPPKDPHTSRWRKAVDSFVDSASNFYFWVASTHLVEQSGIFRRGKIGAWIQTRPIGGRLVHLPLIGGLFGFTLGGFLEYAVLPGIFSGLATWGIKHVLHKIYGPPTPKEKEPTIAPPQVNQPHPQQPQQRTSPSTRPLPDNGLTPTQKQFFEPTRPNQSPSEAEPWMSKSLPPPSFPHPADSLFTPTDQTSWQQNAAQWGLPPLEAIATSQAAQEHQAKEAKLFEQLNHAHDIYFAKKEKYLGNK